jgi:hypothetical protein
MAQASSEVQLKDKVLKTDKANFFSLLPASVEGLYCLHRMDVQDTNKFSPFLQSAEDAAHDAVARVPAEFQWPRNLSRASTQKTAC